MSKFSLYVLLILVYLGISKSFSPYEKRSPFIANEKVFSSHFEGSPLSIILLDSFSSGFLIKTYHHKYRVVRAFREPEEVIVRTSKDFWYKNLKHRGMSLFRRKEGTNKSSTVIMPPGALFIGDLSYGSWAVTDYGSKEWKFYRTYKKFPEYFNWKDFRPNIKFYRKMKIFLSDNIAFYGSNSEFGSSDDELVSFDITKTRELNIDLIIKTVKKYFSFPKWN